MSRLAFIEADELRRSLPMEAAIDALERAFRDGNPSAAPLRTHVETASGSLLVMPAAGPEGAGVKLVTVSPENPARGLPFIHATYVLFSPETQAPEAVMDGAALTALRTAAVSGLATRWLARADAHRLVIFGAGVQARSHLEAMRAVRPIEEVVVVSRSPGPAEVLAGEARTLGLRASVGESEAVAQADVVCTCTTSEIPVFPGWLLAQGTHVNAVGAFRPETRELDDETIRRARLVVETREAALEEAGDLLIPIGAGIVGPQHVIADLGEVVRGAGVRRSPAEVTVFESVGLAFEDLVVARAVFARRNG